MFTVIRRAFVAGDQLGAELPGPGRWPRQFLFDCVKVLLVGLAGRLCPSTVSLPTSARAFTSALGRWGRALAGCTLGAALAPIMEPRRLSSSAAWKSLF